MFLFTKDMYYTRFILSFLLFWITVIDLGDSQFTSLPKRFPSVVAYTELPLEWVFPETDLEEVTWSRNGIAVLTVNSAGTTTFSSNILELVSKGKIIMSSPATHNSGIYSISVRYTLSSTKSTLSDSITVTILGKGTADIPYCVYIYTSYTVKAVYTTTDEITIRWKHSTSSSQDYFEYNSTDCSQLRSSQGYSKTIGATCDQASHTYTITVPTAEIWEANTQWEVCLSLSSGIPVECKTVTISVCGYYAIIAVPIVFVWIWIPVIVLLILCCNKKAGCCAENISTKEKVIRACCIIGGCILLGQIWTIIGVLLFLKKVWPMSKVSLTVKQVGQVGQEIKHAIVVTKDVPTTLKCSTTTLSKQTHVRWYVGNEKYTRSTSTEYTFTPSDDEHGKEIYSSIIRKAGKPISSAKYTIYVETNERSIASDRSIDTKSVDSKNKHDRDRAEQTKEANKDESVYQNDITVTEKKTKKKPKTKKNQTDQV